MSEGQLEYNIYPEYTDEDFIFNVSNRLEFHHLKSLFNITELSKKCPSDNKKNDPFNFELTNNQQFLKNFMNHKTPYKSLVIFHGVGVGKTCSAINISKSYRDVFYKNNKKIICLVPKNIRGGWENTIYDPSKDTNQCSGDSFEDIIIRDKKGNVGKRDVKNLIREYYDFYGYLAFANSVDKLIQNEVKKRLTKPTEEELEEITSNVIAKNFSHRVLIIDELHNLREENESKREKDKKFRKGDEVFHQEKGTNVRIVKKQADGNYIVSSLNGEGEEIVNPGVLSPTTVDRKSKDIIEKVIRYSKGLRLVLLSATPMFNKSSEIVWLLNLLLKNDNRETINKEDIFDKDDTLTDRGINIIENNCRGYFSYLRGENPITFPIRFYPDINRDVNCIGGDATKASYQNYPQYKIDGVTDIEESEQFKFMKMYSSIMDGDQKYIYESFIDDISQEINENNLNLSNRNIGSQLSNVVFYNEGDYHKDCFGQKGFEKIFNVKSSRRSKKCSYINEDNQILSMENLKSCSSKIHTITDNMLKNHSEGIIFIYSDYIYSGILPLAIALEHIGFQKYNGENILEVPKKTKIDKIGHDLKPLSKNNKQAKYIILTGDKSLSPNNEKERKDSLNINNMNGENIKIILGNSVTSEGMDFKNIREIHVLDPWYHLYKIEQIIGRGIRYCSHSYHKKEKQNVTVFLHTALIDKNVESIDTNTYRIAEKKASDIGKVEKILKENAIDAYLNKSINHITGMKNITMKTTWGNRESIDINDKEYTKICSFLKNGCNIDINTDLEKYEELTKYEGDINDKITDDTFSVEDISESIKEIYSIVKELFSIYEVYKLSELKSRIKEVIDTDERIIEHALDNICDDKKVIWNGNNISGYLLNKNDIYLFQPKTIKDELVPFIYRSNDKIDKVNLDNSLFSNIKVEFKDIFHCESSYNEVYQKIKNFYDSNLENEFEDYKLIIPSLDKEVIKNRYIDSLTYDEKVVLLKEILCGYISSGGKAIQDRYDKEIFDFFENNLIYEEGGEYYTFEKRGKVVGFFLCNPDKYNRIQDVFKNLDYFEYDGEWKYIDEVGIEILKNNAMRNKDLKVFFKSGKVWGYSFKEDKNKHVFKIVDLRYGIHDNEPGKVIGDKGFPMLTLLQEFMNNFEDNHSKYVELMIETLMENVNDSKLSKIDKEIETIAGDLSSLTKYLYKELRGVKKQHIITKDFITKMYEYSSRSVLKFFSYDTFLFKFIKSL